MKLLVVAAVVAVWLLFCGWVLYQMFLDERIGTADLMLMLMQEDRDADQPHHASPPALPMEVVPLQPALPKRCQVKKLMYLTFITEPDRRSETFVITTGNTFIVETAGGQRTEADTAGDLVRAAASWVDKPIVGAELTLDQGPGIGTWFTVNVPAADAPQWADRLASEEFPS